MDLMIGTVVAKGTKENVKNMYKDLEEYYDKAILSESGSDENYEIAFEFFSRLISFLSYDYFKFYSEEYNCHIIATMLAEDMDDDDEPMILEYKNGEIIQGLIDYGLVDE